jgi:hypothetical protein
VSERETDRVPQITPTAARSLSSSCPTVTNSATSTTQT